MSLPVPSPARRAGLPVALSAGLAAVLALPNFAPAASFPLPSEAAALAFVGQPPAAGRRGRGPGEGRDPFRPPEREGPEERPPGLAGLRVVEASVRGVLRRSGSAGAAGPQDAVILEAPDGRGFVASPGAKLMDGVLLRVEEDGAVFATNRKPPREIFRPLRAGAPSGSPSGPAPASP